MFFLSLALVLGTANQSNAAVGDTKEKPTQTGNYYTGDHLRKLLVGQVVTLNAGGVITYGLTGEYSFVTANNRHRGIYEITNTHVCVTFITGQERCDRYVKDNGSVFFENFKGGRFTVLKIDGEAQ